MFKIITNRLNSSLVKSLFSTQAIFQGDKILAINNISLAGKTLKEAIELLQNGCDTVTLKISRKNRNLIDNNLNFERNSYDLNKISSDISILVFFYQSPF